MMSTESANSFTLIGEASDGGTMENLSRRLKVNPTSTKHSYENFNTVFQSVRISVGQVIKKVSGHSYLLPLLKSNGVTALQSN